MNYGGQYCPPRKGKVNQQNSNPMYAPSVTTEVDEEIERMFNYHAWDQERIDKGTKVRRALCDAVKVIIDNVPPCPQRTRAINNLVDARMLANSAITHDGRF